MRRFFTLFFTLFFVLSLADLVSASIINGDFETGDLMSWNISGPGAISVEYHEANHYALMNTGYDPISGGFITTLSQDFKISANPLALTFDFLFETNPPGPFIFIPDALTVSLLTNRGDLHDFLIVDYSGIIYDPLAKISPSLVFPGGYNLSLNLSDFAGADAILYFDLWDEDDFVDSRAKIDNVVSHSIPVSVPVPGAMILLGSGLFSLLGLLNLSHRDFLF